MIKIQSKKYSQYNWMDEIQDVDWGDDSSQNQVVDDDSLSSYLVDDVEKYPSEQESLYNEPQNFEYDMGWPTSPPQLPENIEEIPYQSARNLIYDGMDNAEVVGFEYTTRHGAYAGQRTVEPHFSFVAQGTGNEVLVAYDLSPNVNDIRAFIVGNIHPYGVRYKGYNFKPKAEIMRGLG